MSEREKMALSEKSATSENVARISATGSDAQGHRRVGNEFDRLLRSTAVAFLVLSALTLPGCASARVVVEDLHVEGTEALRKAVRREPKREFDQRLGWVTTKETFAVDTSAVPVYDGSITNPPGIPFAKLGVHGNGYATREFLQKKLAEAGGELGADFVVWTQAEVVEGPTVASYGGGVMIADKVHTLHLYGRAYVRSPVAMGLHWSSDYTLIDVHRDGPADRAGLKIGDRLLAINGRRGGSDALLLYRVMAQAKPGDHVELDVVGTDNQQRVVNMTFGPPDAE